MSDRLAAFFSWLVFSVLVLATLTAVLFLGEVAFAGKAAGHHSCEFFLAETVKPRESGGDYTAVNLKASEYHPKWKTTGSFGAYQIAVPLWKEELRRQGLDEWEGWFPHWTPAWLQDRIALGICERYGRCPWLTGQERRDCWQRL